MVLKNIKYNMSYWIYHLLYVELEKKLPTVDKYLTIVTEYYC